MNTKMKLIIAALIVTFSLSSFSLLNENNTTKDDISTNDAFAISLKYYNKDSKSYEFKVKSCGRTSKVKFDRSKSSMVTIQTGCSDAIIFDECGEVKVEKGDKITIKNGCIKID